MLYIHTVLVFVYQLRWRGTRLTPLSLIQRPVLRGNLRLSDPENRHDRLIGRAVLLDEKGHGIVEPLDVMRVRVRELGMLLRGSQMMYRSKSPKANRERVPQSWFCSYEALPIQHWYDEWQARLLALKEAEAPFD